MKFSAPMLLLFFVSAALAISSVIGFVHVTPGLTEHKYLLMAAAYGVLSLGVIFKTE